MMAKVKHYVGQEHPCLQAFGDEWDIAEPREEAEELAVFINTLAERKSRAEAEAYERCLEVLAQARRDEPTVRALDTAIAEISQLAKEPNQ